MTTSSVPLQPAVQSVVWLLYCATYLQFDELVLSPGWVARVHVCVNRARLQRLLVSVGVGLSTRAVHNFSRGSKLGMNRVWEVESTGLPRAQWLCSLQTCCVWVEQVVEGLLDSGQTRIGITL